MSVEVSDFHRENNDVNGNSRFAIHFLDLLTEWKRGQYGYGWDIQHKYSVALARARQWGGKKFHNKKFGGGIIFQEYEGCLPDFVAKINLILSAENAKQIGGER